MASAAVKTAARIDCRCGHMRIFVRSTMESRYDQRGRARPEPVITEVDHACICKASQDPSADACWMCLHGHHRRTRVA